jgi:uncharacterized protein YcfL
MVDHDDRVALEHLEYEVAAATRRNSDTDLGDAFVENRAAVLSIAWSLRSRPYLWNGLRCGGAYLDADEYSFFADLLERHGIRTAVETGAGETTILLHRAAVRGMALEANPGPWLDRARHHGAACAFVPFEADHLRFEPSALDAALTDIGPVDLLFIDSPIGTANRSRLVAQLHERLGSPMVLVHDAHRDVTNLLGYMASANLRVCEYLESRRGMVLLAPISNESPRLVVDPLRPNLDAPVTVPAVSIEVLSTPDALVGQHTTITVRVRNRSASVLTSRSALPVHLSYHVYDFGGGGVQFEGARTPLPCNLRRGDSIELALGVDAPLEPGRYRLGITAVQEGVAWFDDIDPSSRTEVELSVR